MTQYSAISPPPMRGFVIRPFHNGGWKDDVPTFSTKRVPIVGVVVKTIPGDDDAGWGACSEVLPVILVPSYASDLSGGMRVYDADDWGDPAFTAAWCHWPPEEDERRLADLHAFVAEEARATLIRQTQAAKRAREGKK